MPSADCRRRATGSRPRWRCMKCWSTSGSLIGWSTEEPCSIASGFLEGGDGVGAGLFQLGFCTPQLFQTARVHGEQDLAVVQCFLRLADIAGVIGAHRDQTP